jgi:hypothetical protein
MKQLPRLMLRRLLVFDSSREFLKGEADLDEWRRILLEAVGSKGQLIVSLVPELGFVIGYQNSPRQICRLEKTRNRFQLVFRRFLRELARPTGESSNTSARLPTSTTRNAKKHSARRSAISRASIGRQLWSS